MSCCKHRTHCYASASPAATPTWRVFPSVQMSTKYFPHHRTARTARISFALHFSKLHDSSTIPNLVTSPAPQSLAHTTQPRLEARQGPASHQESKTKEVASPCASRNVIRSSSTRNAHHFTYGLQYHLLGQSHCLPLVLPNSRVLKSSHTDADVNQVVVTSVVIAITAILVCMCYMVNASRKRKQFEDVSWEMQVRGIGAETEMREIRSQKEEDVKG